MFVNGSDLSYESFIPRWIQIDLDAIKFNIEKVKSLLSPGTELMAVVKSNAYGCGAVEVSETALEAGAGMLGVTTIDEGIELRSAGIKAPILVFSPLQVEEIKAFADYGLSATVGGLQILNALYENREAFKHIPVHIKVDTGMNRIGVFSGEVERVLEEAHSAGGIKPEGLYTHFAASGSTDERFISKQFDAFMDVSSSLLKKGYEIPCKHVCSSAAVLDNKPEMHLDMVRIGTLIYGQHPFGYEKLIELKNPWRARAKIIQVKDVPTGETVGYGRDFIAKKDLYVGIIPLGLADGFGVSPNFRPKNLIDLFKMLVKTLLQFFGIHAGVPLVNVDNRNVKVVGRIGMQFTAIDLTDMKHIKTGHTVNVHLRRTNASSRLPRIFISKNRIKKIRGIDFKEF